MIFEFTFIFISSVIDPQAAKSTPTSPGATAAPPSSTATKRGTDKSAHAPAKRTKGSASKQKHQLPSSSQQ